MFRTPAQLGWPLVIAIVALRLAIGFHFFSEGTAKVQGKFDAAGFLQSAKGPLAPLYHSMVWDHDGKIRTDLEGTKDYWGQYLARVSEYYEFDEEQAEEAAKYLKDRTAQIEYVFAVNDEAMEKFRPGLETRAAYRTDRGRMEVASLGAQVEKMESDAKTEIAPVLAAVDKVWDGFESDIQSIAGETRLPLSRPGAPWVGRETINRVIPYFDVVIGVLLILGLFTRAAAIVGAGFLLSVMASQMPGALGATPLHYQMVEGIGLVMLAIVGAGRYVGLDFLIRSLCVWCCPSKCASANRGETASTPSPSSLASGSQGKGSGGKKKK